MTDAIAERTSTSHEEAAEANASPAASRGCSLCGNTGHYRSTCPRRTTPRGPATHSHAALLLAAAAKLSARLPIFSTEDLAVAAHHLHPAAFALQGFPLYDGDGRAIVLSGANISAWSERIGNAVPPPTAKAVAEQMLLTLLHAEAGVFVLSSGGGAWVQPGRAPRWMRVLGVEDLIPRAKRAAKKHAARCGSFAPIEPGDPWASLVTPGLPQGAVLQ